MGVAPPCSFWTMARAYLNLAIASLICAVAAPRARAQSADGNSGASQERQRIEIVVASTTDVHGRIRAWDYFTLAPDPVRGLSRAATIVDSLRTANPGRVVLVDAGDLLQGNPLTYVAARVDTGGIHPVIAAMNVMRYDAAAVGNHEFNYGLPRLRRALRDATFPFLATNVRMQGRERPIFSKSRIVERAGIRIGIVGATTPGSMIWDRDNLRGRLTIGAIVPAVRSEVAAVRRRGANVVVVVMHSGLSEATSYDTASTRLPSENVAAEVARSVPGVDLVVFGHSHREVADTTINGVMLVQPRNWATSVSAATITLEKRGSRWNVISRKGSIVRSVGHDEHPAVVEAVAAKHDAANSWVSQPIGTTSVAWRADSARVLDTPLIDFILEVERKASGADLASTAAFDLNASLDTGAITVAEVARLYPYDNTLRAVRISGAQLRSYLDYSSRYFRTMGSSEAAESLVDPAVPGYNFDIVAGAEYVLDISRPLGQRVTSLSVKGRPVADSDTFTMALSNYRQSGGGGFAMLRDAPLVYDRQEEIRDLLIAEVRRRGALEPEEYHTTNWRLEPATAIGPAYASMRAMRFDAPTTTGASSPHLSSGRWLRIIGTNDFHGALEPREVTGDGVLRGGAAYLVGAIQAARAECSLPTCSSIWLDGGDQFQGTPASNLARGRPVLEIFNRFGMAAAALGNHEFDWGIDTLKSLLRQTRYPVLAANVLDSTGRDVEWLPNDTLLTAGNVKVGVIGVITLDTPDAARPSIVRGLQFVDPVSVIDARARALRQRGADVVVVVAHAGGFCNGSPSARDSSAASCRGEMISVASRLTEHIDAIVAGHTHRGFATMIGRTPITQAYSRGTAVGIIDIPLGVTDQAARFSIRNVRPDSSPAESSVAQDVARVTAQIEERFSTVVAQSAETMRQGINGTLGNLIADAQRVVGKGDVAVMNRGGVRASLAAGPVTVGGIFEIAPFENTLMRLTLGGSRLRAYLEGVVSARGMDFHLSGMRIEVDTSLARGSRIVKATMSDGSELDDRATYRLVLLDFLVEGGDGLGISDGDTMIENTGILDREALQQYLHSLPQPVSAPRDRRIVEVRR